MGLFGHTKAQGNINTEKKKSAQIFPFEKKRNSENMQNKIYHRDLQWNKSKKKIGELNKNI